MYKFIAVILMSLMLYGCNTKPIATVSEPKRIIHPELPSPVDPYKFDWKVIVIDEKTVIVGLDYDQSIDFRIFLDDIKRYMKETNVILCSYRKELKEPQCNPVKK